MSLKLGGGSLIVIREASPVQPQCTQMQLNTRFFEVSAMIAYLGPHNTRTNETSWPQMIKQDTQRRVKVCYKMFNGCIKIFYDKILGIMVI